MSADRPLRTISLNIDEGDDLDRLRAAFDLGSDAVFFDLEDHVPRPKLPLARQNLRTILEERGSRTPIFIRVNRYGRPEMLDDLEAVVCPELFGVVLPKIQHEDEIKFLDQLLSMFESRAGVEVGSTRIIPLLETTHGIRRAYEVAKASPRVDYLGGMVNQHGDPARSIGYQWTREMDETLYVRQKVLIDARAGGVTYPVCGVWNPAADLEGFENFAVACRNIGYFGLMTMPLPEHVEIANRVFTPTQEEIDYWAEIVELMDAVQEDELVPDLVVQNQIIPANRGGWGRIRLALGAAYGVVPSSGREKLVADNVGRASEAWRGLASKGSDPEGSDPNGSGPNA
jgi:citrate lyase subunit beta/citryl-CoA lyase